MNRYLALKGEDKFDINKVTVVGTPTITNDGVASGFTTNNYLSILPIIQLGNYDNWELVSPKFTTSNTINGVAQAVFWATYNTWHGGIRIGIASIGKLYTQLASQDNTDRDILVFDSVNAMPNTTYQMKIKFTGSQYIVWYKVNNADWIEYGRVETSTKVYNTWTEMFVGNISNWSFLGSIDLNAFKIYVDNQLIYTPTKPTHLLERRKEGFDLSKFEVVGSPTIAEDGVASGFSSGNYLTATTFNLNTSTWKIKGSFKTPTTLTQVSQKIFGSTLIYDGVNLGIYSNLVQLSASNTGISMNIIDATSSQTVLPNTLYYYEVVFNGASYKVNLSTDNKNWITYIDKATNLTANSFTIQMGAFRNGLAPFLGSIDLKQFSIIVDGKEVFTGAKVGHYVLRR